MVKGKLDNDFIALGDIVKAIDETQQFIQRTSLNDRMAVMAVAYEIAIIGEAAGRLSTVLRSKYTHVPWSDIIGMRHRIIHGYGKVSIDRLKEVVDKHLPVLKGNIQKIIDDLQIEKK